MYIVTAVQRPILDLMIDWLGIMGSMIGRPLLVMCRQRVWFKLKPTSERSGQEVNTVLTPQIGLLLLTVINYTAFDLLANRGASAQSHDKPPIDVGHGNTPFY